MKFSGLGRGLESLIPKSAPSNQQQNATVQNGEKLRHKESRGAGSLPDVKVEPYLKWNHAKIFQENEATRSRFHSN